MRAGDLSKTLIENFLCTAAAHGEDLAFTFLSSDETGVDYTFANLFDRAREIGEKLGRLGLPAHAPVGILLAHQEAQILHYLAALAAGLAPAILTPPNRKLSRDYYLRTTQAVLQSCGFCAVVTDLEGLCVDTRVLQPFSILETCNARSSAGARRGVDGTFLQFSSGTTGIKRGVLVSDEAALRQLIVYGEAIGINRADRIVSWLPLYHDMGFIACLNLPLLFGVHTVMMDPIHWVADPARYLRAVSRFRATLSWNPNFAYAFMATRVPERAISAVDLSSLRGLINCSEPVTLASQSQFMQAFASKGLRRHVFWGCYAMAETTFALTHGTSTDADYLDVKPPGTEGCCMEPLVAVGRPLAGVELSVINDAGETCENGEVGEMWVRSPFNVKSYYNDAQATEAAFHGDWYKTGDLGYCRNGQFYVVGRKTDMLIIAGSNIHPQDIENEVSSVAGIKPGRTVAFSVRDEQLQTERMIILAERAAGDFDVTCLVQEIRKRVCAGFNVSNFGVELVSPGWLIKSSAGKIARRANREKWRAQMAIGRAQRGRGRG